MTTLIHSRRSTVASNTNHAVQGSRVSQIAVPAGRVLFSLIFLIAGFGHFSGASVSYAASQGVPFADVLVPASGVMAIVGGLSVLLGTHARFGALLLVLFLVPVTLTMHSFWSINDPNMAQMEFTNFLKNLALIGGALLIIFYGAGPYSLDQMKRKQASD